MIELIPIGEVEKATLESLGQLLTEVFCQETHIGSGIALPPESLNERRSQHLARMLLALLPLTKGKDRVLGVVDVDIYAPGLNFVFGEADILGKRALISLSRLRQEFYGLRRDETLFRERVRKEAVHELGHTYGLGHCPDPTCVMHFSNRLADTDFKGWNFCVVCGKRVNPKSNQAT